MRYKVVVQRTQVSVPFEVEAENREDAGSAAFQDVREEDFGGTGVVEDRDLVYVQELG